MVNEALRQPVIAFGELLLRLDTPGNERFVQADALRVSFTGGEANVAVALAQWGLPARIVSKVPEHEIGQACLNHFRRYGVSTEFVSRGGDRLGILYVETGASQRGSKVLYDRLHSSFRHAAPADFDWNTIFDGAGWFHFSGTAPALGEPVRRILDLALSECRQRHIPVSFDCSYRSTLWSTDEAARVLPPLLEQVDLFVGSEHDAALFFGVRETGTESLFRLRDRYGLECVAYTERDVSPTGINRYSAVVLAGDAVVTSPVYEMTVVDRIGAGDAFTAGLIRGRLLNLSLHETVNFAVAAAVLKHTIPGDFALLSIAEIEQLARGDSMGRVQR